MQSLLNLLPTRQLPILILSRRYTVLHKLILENIQEIDLPKIKINTTESILSIHLSFTNRTSALTMFMNQEDWVKKIEEEFLKQNILEEKKIILTIKVV
jgi:hypothetical protein